MEESHADHNNALSPVMQRLELLKSQLESNDEVIHEMERSLKGKAYSNAVEPPVNELEYLKQIINSLEEKVASAETTIFNFEQEIEEKNKLLEARTMVISVLQKDVEAKRVATNAMFEKTQQEIQNMEENFITFKENMAIENKKLLEQLDGSRQRYQKLDLKLQETEREKVTLIQMNEDLSFQIENITAVNNQLKMKVGELTNNIDSSQQRIIELADELESMKQEFKNTVHNLELERADYEGDCQQMKKSYQENQQLLKSEVTRLKDENNNLASKVSSLETEISDLKNGKNQEESTLPALSNEKELLISKMEQTIKHLHSERDELINRLAQAENSIEIKESKFEQSKVEVVELRSALDAAKSHGTSEDMACLLNNEINLLQDQLCQSKKEFQQEKQRVSMLSETIDELEEKIQDCDLLLLEEKQNTINIKKELDHLKQQVAAKEEELAREKASAMQLQQNFYHVLNELEQYKQNFSQNSNDMREIQEKLASAEEEKGRLETVISSLLRDVISLTAKSTETEINFEKENQLYVVLQEKFAELSNLFTQTTTDLKKKENEIVNLHKELDNLVRSKEDGILNLQAERDDLLQSKECMIANLQTELDSLKQKEEDHVSVRDMEAYIGQQDEMIKELTASAQAKAEEANHLAASCEELKQKLNEYAAYTASELGNRDNIIKNLESSLQSKSEGGNSFVELETLQARVNYLEQLLKEATSKIEEQIFMIKKLEDENEMLNSKISEVPADSELSELKRILADNQEKLAEKTQSLDELSAQYNRLLSTFTSVQSESDKKLQELNALIDQKESAFIKLKSEYELTCSQLMEIQQQLESKVELSNRIHTRIDGLLSENENYKIQCSELSRQLEDLQISGGQKLRKVEHELMEVTSVTEHLRDKNITLLSQVTKFSDQIDQYGGEKEALTDKLGNIIESLQESKDENLSLKEEISVSSRLLTQIHNLEQLIEEKNHLNTVIQSKTCAKEENIQKLDKSFEIESTAQNSVSSLLKGSDVDGCLLPLAQEYLRMNHQLMVLKDLLEDLVNCEIHDDADIRLILENLESDLQESELAFKTYESKRRKSPGFSNDSLESSVSALSSYVNQITKQISTCGEVLKDWILLRTPPKKSMSSVEIQTDFLAESKLTSGLNLESLDDWSWDVENNEDSEVKPEDDLSYGSLGEQNYIQNAEPKKLVSKDDDKANAPLHRSVIEPNFVQSLDPNKLVPNTVVETYVDLNAQSPSDISLTIENNFEQVAVNPNISVNRSHVSDASEVVSNELTESQFTRPLEEKLHGEQNLDLVSEKLTSQLAPIKAENYPANEDQSLSHFHLNEHTSSVGHVCEHGHTHEHLHSSHNHGNVGHEDSHQIFHGSHEENTRPAHVSHKEDNEEESKLSDHSHFYEENSSRNYLQDNQLIVVNKAHVEDMKMKLDSVLYTLHEKDVQNSELTRELIELLKERDILQLKLSSAYRLLASQEKETTASNGTSSSIKNEELISKINELDSLSGWHDPMVKTETEQKNMQVLYSNQALPVSHRSQKESHSTEAESESTISSLFNWIAGSW